MPISAFDMKRESFSALVPFSGFYQSYHDELIDREIGYNSPSSRRLSEMFSDGIDHCQVANLYARKYTKKLSDVIGITLTFEEVSSPKFYNYANDRLFAKITRQDFATILRKVRGKKLEKVCREWFTSRNGFISSYSNVPGDWGSPEDWDHNQVGAALSAWTDLAFAETEWTENSIADSIYESGSIGAFVFMSLNSEARRAVKISRYLVARKSRLVVFTCN